MGNCTNSEVTNCIKNVTGGDQSSEIHQINKSKSNISVVPYNTRVETEKKHEVSTESETDKSSKDSRKLSATQEQRQQRLAAFKKFYQEIQKIVLNSERIIENLKKFDEINSVTMDMENLSEDNIFNDPKLNH